MKTFGLIYNIYNNGIFLHKTLKVKYLIYTELIPFLLVLLILRVCRILTFSLSPDVKSE